MSPKSERRATCASIAGVQVGRVRRRGGVWCWAPGGGLREAHAYCAYLLYASGYSCHPLLRRLPNHRASVWQVAHVNMGRLTDIHTKWLLENLPTMTARQRYQVSRHSRQKTAIRSQCARSNAELCESWLGWGGDGRELTIALGGVKSPSMQQEESGYAEPPNFLGRGPKSGSSEGFQRLCHVRFALSFPRLPWNQLQ